MELKTLNVCLRAVLKPKTCALENISNTKNLML